jgi:transcription elongation factor Elf1
MRGNEPTEEVGKEINNLFKQADLYNKIVHGTSKAGNSPSVPGLAMSESIANKFVDSVMKGVSSEKKSDQREEVIQVEYEQKQEAYSPTEEPRESPHGGQELLQEGNPFRDAVEEVDGGSRTESDPEDEGVD